MKNESSYEIKRFQKENNKIMQFDGDLEKLLAEINETFPNKNFSLIIDKVNEIIIGSEKDLNRIEDVKFIKDLRAFSSEKEFHLFLRKGKFYYRVIKDLPVSKEESTEFEEAVESFQYERHLGRKIKLRTYIDYDELGQAGYYDFRIVEISEVK